MTGKAPAAVRTVGTDDAGVPPAHVRNVLPVRTSAGSLVEALEQAGRSGHTYINFLDHRNRENRLSFRDVLEGARRYANVITNRGLKKGSCVLILLPTGPEFVFSFFGTQLAGGVPVPAVPPAGLGNVPKHLESLGHIARDCRADLVVTCRSLRKALSPLASHGAPPHGTLCAEDVADEKPRRTGRPSCDADSVALIQYTSGSTSLPKGVVLTHGNVLGNVHGIGTALGMSDRDQGVSWLPLFHDMGLIGVLLTALYWRYTVHVMAPESFLLQPVRWLENIGRYGARLSPAPNFAYHLCVRRVRDEQLDGLDLSSWRTALNGAEPVDVSTVEAFRERFAGCGFGEKVMLPVYGMAENCLAAAFPERGSNLELRELDRQALEGRGAAVDALPGDGAPYRAVSVGYPLAGQSVAVSDGGGGFAREGEVGEVLVGGCSVMRGYHRGAEQTARVLRGGWLHTGDLGFISGRRLFVTGRAREVIIKMGRNHYPYDLERVASEIEGVRKGCVAAFSFPDPGTGTEQVVVVAESRAAGSPEAPGIEKSVRGEILARLGVRVDRVLVVPPRVVPKTTSGKVQRVRCRAAYLAGALGRHP